MTHSSDWPKPVTAYVHGSKEGMYDIGHGLGLRGESLQLFKYALCEVQVHMSVNRDGTYTIIEVKG